MKSSSEEETNKVKNKSHLEEASISFMQNENKEKNKSDEEFERIKSDIHKREFIQDDDDFISKKPESKSNVRRDSEIKIIKIDKNENLKIKNFELIKSICNTKYFRGNV
jgi:hypothetical protein